MSLWSIITISNLMFQKQKNRIQIINNQQVKVSSLILILEQPDNKIVQLHKMLIKEGISKIRIISKIWIIRLISNRILEPRNKTNMIWWVNYLDHPEVLHKIPISTLNKTTVIKEEVSILILEMLLQSQELNLISWSSHKIPKDKWTLVLILTKSKNNKSPIMESMC